ncbi:hypothetical protein [Wohlfahrtiimonas larvae]|uniref:Tail fiber protein n=1 Tax=Wohlfahrtiimonas larvae TaxID=1157986 RepID=A0ABP9MWG6_9GAMM|nr:hypothetical protein [Wohlfahrtiimonas larvae]
MIIDIPTVEGGEFIDGGPNTLGTIVRANFLNSLMKSSTATTKEIQTVLSKNGIQPDDRVHDQLFKAISKMVTDGKVTLTDVLGTSKTLAASQFLVNEVNKKIPPLSSTLSDNTTQAATPKMVNDVNRKAVLAQTTAENADAEAKGAKKKADQVPNPAANNFVVGNTTTAYKLMTVAQVKSLLGVPAATKLYGTIGQAIDGAMTQKAVTDAMIGFNQKYYDVMSERVRKTKYTNTTGKPIFASLYKTNNQSGGYFYVDDQIVAYFSNGAQTATATAVIIPPESTYYYDVALSNFWELR